MKPLISEVIYFQLFSDEIFAMEVDSLFNLGVQNEMFHLFLLSLPYEMKDLVCPLRSSDFVL